MAELSPEELYDAMYGELPTGASRLTPWQRKVAEMGERLRTRPEYLHAIMQFETGGTLDPAVKNQAGSGATGLIQFTPVTAKSLGTTTDALARMLPQEQLAQMEKYLEPYAGKMGTLKDSYLAVLKPAAIGKPEWYPLFSQKDQPKAYEQNKGLDRDKKGTVTVGDALREVKRWLGPDNAEAAPAKAKTMTAEELYEAMYGPAAVSPGQTGSPAPVAPTKPGQARAGSAPAPAPASGVPSQAPQGSPAGPTPEALYEQLYGAGRTQPPATLLRLTPDMSEDDAIRALGFDPKVIRQSKFYTEGDVTKNVTDPQGKLATTLRLPVIRQALSVVRGGQEVAEGALQLGARGAKAIGMASDADVQYYDMMVRLAAADYSQNIRQGSTVDPQTGEGGILQDPLRLVGGALATGGVGGAASTLPRRVAQSAIAGAVAAGVQPVVNDAGKTYWEQKQADVLPGAVAGAGGGVGAEILGPLTRKGGNWLRGVVTPALQDIAETAQRLGVPLSYGDIRRTGLVPWLEKQLERVPFSGAGSLRRRQTQAAEQTVAALETGVKERLRATPWQDMDAVEAAAQQGNKQAENVLKELRRAGDDLGAIVQGSAKLQVVRNILKGEELYSTVDELAAPLGNMQIPRTMDALQRLANDKEELPLLSPEMKTKVLGTLETLTDYVTDPTRGDYSYSSMRALRSRLQAMAREAQEPPVARALGQVADAVDDDLGRFAEDAGVPELRTAARRADQWWKNRVVADRDSDLTKAAAKDLPDEIYNKFMRAGKSRAQQFYQGLDDRGKAAVRAGILERARDKALLNDPEVFDPVAWSRAIQREEEASGVFFKGTDAWEFAGAARVLQHLRQPRASTAGGSLTSAAIGSGLGAGSVIGLGVPATGAIAGGLALGGQLMLSPLGRRFLLASSKLEPGSPALQRLLDRFMRDNPSLLGTAAGQREE